MEENTNTPNSDNNETSSAPQPRRNLRREKAINDIINNALNSKSPRELTYQQAFSIHLRSQQLMNEGNDRVSQIQARERARQIEVCYAQRKQNLQ